MHGVVIVLDIIGVTGNVDASEFKISRRQVTQNFIILCLVENVVYLVIILQHKKPLLRN